MEDKTVLGGFDVFNDFNLGNKTNSNETNTDNFASEELSDEELEALRSKNDDVKDNKEDDNTNNNASDDISGNVNDDDDQRSKKDKKDKVEQVVEDQPEDVPEDNQKELVSSFFETIADRFGWDITEEDQVPTTPEELVQYFTDVIEENSKPEYASEEIEQLDNFVKNGGNLKDYLQIDKELDLESLDIKNDENAQKAVLKEFLKEKGFNKTQIEKKLSKYEDAGIIEDEAEDAFESLKEIREQKKQQLLENQEKLAIENQRQQQAYVNNVVSTLKSMDDIYGVKLSDKDKARVLNFMFKPDADGKTALQKKWSENIRYFIETAYLVMDGDNLFKKSEQKGSNNAINRFKLKLNNTGVSRQTNKQPIARTEDLWDNVTRMLRANNV